MLINAKMPTLVVWPGPEVMKLFMLNSTEHEILLIKIKYRKVEKFHALMEKDFLYLGVRS